MRKVILHLGTPKTGSTTIQRFLHANAEVLANDSAAYPSAGRKLNSGRPGWSHSALFAKLTNRREDVYSILTDINEEAATQEKVIISSELFFEKLHKRKVQRALKKIKTFFEHDEIKVIIYIRRWDSYLESVYNQAVKATMFGLRAREPINDFITRCEEVIGWHPADYLQYLAILEGIFGKDALEIRSFDRKALVGGELLQDFCEAIAIKSMAPYKIPRKANESLTAKQLLIVSLLSPMYRDKGKLLAINEIRKLFKDDAVQFNRHCFLDKDERQAIINRFKPDEEKLRSYMRDPSGFLFDLDASGDKSHLPPVQFSFEELKIFRDLILDAEI